MGEGGGDPGSERSDIQTKECIFFKNSEMFWVSKGLQVHKTKKEGFLGPCIVWDSKPDTPALLSTLHPNTILKRNPDPNTHAQPSA